MTSSFGFSFVDLLWFMAYGTVFVAWICGMAAAIVWLQSWAERRGEAR